MSAGMAILTDASKGRFRALLARNRPHAFVLYLPVTTTAQGRETITGYTAIAAGDCRMSALTSDDKERLVGAVSVATRRYVVFLDVAVPVLQTHIVKVTGVTPTDSDDGDREWTRYLQVDALDAPDRANWVEQKVLTTEVDKTELLT